MHIVVNFVDRKHQAENVLSLGENTERDLNLLLFGYYCFFIVVFVLSKNVSSKL